MEQTQQQGRVILVPIEDEVKQSYLKYAMSVIVSRALPDARDGLKPVHRRILFGMNEMGLHANRPPKKSARIVGDVLGKYHPHGDLSVYDALVRMAQDFSLRYPLIKGQGNFGSVDGDPPAAMRYTEARLALLAEELLRDINKETVNFVANYDDSMIEPEVLPAAFPCLLANGASGIAVGMATNIPPHNLKEIANAISAYIKNPDITIDSIMNYIPAPDFPTGGIIYGTKGIRQAYKTGRGKITIRSKFTFEQTKSGRDVIIVQEIPYQVNKANLIIRIAEHIQEKKIEGISDLRDESDRNGLRIVIELKKGVTPQIVLNRLFNNTQLQVNFNVNALALINGKPKLLSIKDMIACFVKHRQEIITRRTKFELRKAEERVHLLEGLKIALSNIDEVIRLIKESESVKVAQNQLIAKFALSDIQAKAILDMQLQKLTNLETQKILDELQELVRLVAELRELLSSKKNILQVVEKESTEIAEQFGQERITELVNTEIVETDLEDLIEKETMIVLVSRKGYIKRVPAKSYRVQHRGGKGVTTSNLREEDYIQHLFIASTLDYTLLITNKAKAYCLRVHNIPMGSRNSRGTHIRTLLGFTENEDLASMVPLQEFRDDQYIFLATAHGIVKKMATASFRNAKGRGIIAMNLQADDSIITAILVSEEKDSILATKMGYGLKFHNSDIRPSGRTTQGIHGIRLRPGDIVAGVVEIEQDQDLLIATQFGRGKRMQFADLKVHNRNTMGQKIYTITEETGEIISILAVNANDEIMAVTSSGLSIKVNVSTIRIQGRSAQGVRLVNINENDQVVGIDRISKESEEQDSQN